MLSHSWMVSGILFSWLCLPSPAKGSDGQSFKSRCLSFDPEKYVEHSRRTVLEHVPAGTSLTFADNVASCNRPNQVVASEMCRVALSIATSNRSSITFELWLPEQWSGRFLATGNGGVDGCMYALSS